MSLLDIKKSCKYLKSQTKCQFSNKNCPVPSINQNCDLNLEWKTFSTSQQDPCCMPGLMFVEGAWASCSLFPNWSCSRATCLPWDGMCCCSLSFPYLPHFISLALTYLLPRFFSVSLLIFSFTCQTCFWKKIKNEWGQNSYYLTGTVSNGLSVSNLEKCLPGIFPHGDTSTHSTHSQALGASPEVV